MALILHPAPPFSRGANPRIFEGDFVGMFCRDLDTLGMEQGGGFTGPGFEAGAVGLVFDAADHEVGEVAVFVCEDVKQAGFGVNDFFG